MVKKLDPVRLWVIGLLIVIGSILTYGVVLLNQDISQTSTTIDEVRRATEVAKELSESNNRFLQNFSDYMRCLVVTDEVLYEELGKAAYFDHCDTLLFRGTGLKP